MMFKNSLKLLAANFSTLWKLILYYIIVVGIVIGLTVPFWGTLTTALNADGSLTEIGKLLTTFNVSVDIFAFVGDLFVVISALLTAFVSMFVTYTGVAIYITLLYLYVLPVLLGLADLPVEQTLFGYMSSLTKYGFVGAYARMFGRSIRFQLFKNLVYLPINLAIIASVLGILKLTSLGGLIIYFVPFIAVIAIVLLTALKRTFFCGWIPSIVVYDCNMFVGMTKGWKAVFRRFARVLSTAVVIMIITVAINYLFGTFTFLITIPVTIMFFYIFEMVMFYSSQGMRYYVDLDTILSPKLLEEKDSFKKVSKII